MKNRYCRILTLTVCAVMALLALCAGTASAEEKNTAVLNEIPRDTFTHAYPVSAARAIYPESDSYRKVLMHSDQLPEPVSGYIIPEDSVRLRIEIAADDDAADMVYTDMFQGAILPVTSLLDPDRGVYVYDEEMPDASDIVHHLVIVLYDGSAQNDTRELGIYLFINEETIDEMVAESNAEGPDKYTREYADEERKAEKADEKAQAEQNEEATEPRNMRSRKARKEAPKVVDAPVEEAPKAEVVDKKATVLDAEVVDKEATVLDAPVEEAPAAE